MESNEIIKNDEDHTTKKRKMNMKIDSDSKSTESNENEIIYSVVLYGDYRKEVEFKVIRSFRNREKAIQFAKQAGTTESKSEYVKVHGALYDTIFNSFQEDPETVPDPDDPSENPDPMDFRDLPSTEKRGEKIQKLMGIQ